MPEALQSGDRAPEFEGTVQDGSKIRLEDFAGQRLALYFYPKDNTPGCTKQACNLRDNYSALLDAGIKIVGVSSDSEKSHGNFAAKYELPFPLIADTDRQIQKAYGVWGEKKMYGRSFLGTKRTTFLIDETGRIQAIIRKPKTGGHAAEVLAGFGK